MKNLIMALLMCSTLQVIAQKKTDFSGQYHLDKLRTDFAGKPAFVLDSSLVVNQTADRMIIRKMDDPNILNAPPTDSLLFSGEAFKRKSVSVPGTYILSKLKWISDSSIKLRKEGFNQDGSFRMNTDETWSQEDGGKVLKIIREVEQNDGLKYSITGYYNKKHIK